MHIGARVLICRTSFELKQFPGKGRKIALVSCFVCSTLFVELRVRAKDDVGQVLGHVHPRFTVMAVPHQNTPRVCAEVPVQRSFFAFVVTEKPTVLARLILSARLVQQKVRILSLFLSHLTALSLTPVRTTRLRQVHHKTKPYAP